MKCSSSILLRFILVPLTLLSFACSKQNNTPSPDQGNLVHLPLSSVETPYGFSSGGIVNDRLVTYAIADPSEGRTLIATGPDTSSYVALTPDSVGEAEVTPLTNRVVYIRKTSLYSSNGSITNKLSQDDEVQEYWISSDESKIIYIAKRERGDPVIDRNELYIVDMDGGNRIKLSGDAPGNVLYETTKYSNPPHRVWPRFLPDMSRVVYVITPESSGQSEIHSVNVNGTDNQVLNPALATNTYVGSGGIGNAIEAYNNSFAFDLSPDSSRVIFMITNNNTNPESHVLYSVPADGSSAAVPIGGTMVAGGSVHGERYEFTAAITANSTSVVFFANAESANVTELYSVPIAGGQRIKLSDGSDVKKRVAPLIYANNSRIAYATGTGVYSVALTGGAVTFANEGFSHDVRSMQLKNDESAMIYAIEPIGEIFIAQMDGSDTQNLSGNIVTDGRVLQYYEDVAGDRLVFRAEAESTQDLAIYKVNLDGTGRTRITPDAQHDSPQGVVLGIAHGKVYFQYDEFLNTHKHLYSHDFASNQTTVISTNWQPFIAEDIDRFFNSADGSTQASIAYNSSYSDTGIYMNNASGSCHFNFPLGSIVDVYGPNYAYFDQDNYFYYSKRQDSSGSGYLYYRIDSNCQNSQINSLIPTDSIRMKMAPNQQTIVIAARDGLYAIDPDGSNMRQISTSIHFTNSGGYLFSADSSRVIYRGDDNNAGVEELYSTTLNSLASQRINRDLTGSIIDGIYFESRISPDSQWVVYVAQQDNSYFELYRSAIDGSNNQKLSGTLVNKTLELGNYVSTHVFTPNAQRVLYLLRDTQSGNVDLMSVDLATGNDRQPVNSTLPAGTIVASYSALKYRVRADSQRVAFATYTSTYSPRVLHAGNIDGSGSIEISGTLPQGSTVESFDLDPSSNRILYSLRYNNNNHEFYSVDWDGNNRQLLGDFTIMAPRLTGDGRVVFGATVNNVTGIYVMPVVGGNKQLIVEIPADRRVQDVQISTASDFILVKSDLRVYGIFEVSRHQF